MKTINTRIWVSSLTLLYALLCKEVVAQEENKQNDSAAGVTEQSVNNDKKITNQNDASVAAKKEQSPAKLQKFNVTGSHIKRIDIEGPSPLLVIDRDEIDISGTSTLNELLNKLAINNGLLLNENRTQATSPGAAGINLRGLGQDGTLVLVNGRRFTTYPFAFNVSDNFVDLNSIPLSAVERVEVLKDGASALYGSDAIAGVVNIILRKDFTYSEISEGYGVSEEGDANQVDINYITGKTT
ncbi:MAG: TonB-dependent receptor plug domain-containing protein, partial [Thioalkalispiraceae bacterium]